MSTGVSGTTGAWLGGVEHLHQSVADILTTPIGSRVMRRDYGARLFELIDQPANPVQRLAVLAAAATALRRWEPRLLLERLTLEPLDAAAGRFAIRIEGQALNASATTPVNLSIPIGAST